MQKPVFPFVWLAALGAVVALAAAPPAAGAPRPKEPLPEAPPPAQPQTVKVRRGEPIEISLRIYGQKNEALKYLIRAAPRHGKLTEPRVVGREVSNVTYTPPADLTVTRDRFSYAVQNGAGVSAAVDVNITIVDLPPQLAIPGPLEFPKMLAGATAAKLLEISNRGGGIAEGRAEVEEPWKIDGSPKYRLEAGARTVFKVVFAPEIGGAFESAVRFSSQPETSVPVRGVALAAIAASPSRIVLQSATGDPVRSGVFELTNQTDAESRVTLNGGARLQVPAELTVPARGKVSVPVQTAPGDVTALDGEIRVEASGLTVRVPVQAARLGGLVRATGVPLAFGRVDAAKAASASFELENFGGSPAAVNWEIGAPFVMEEPSVTLAPGEKKRLVLRTQPAAAAGKYRAWLTVKAEQQKLEIPVEAELFGKPAPAPPSAPAPARAGRVSLNAPREEAAPASPDPATSEPFVPAPVLAINPDMQVELTRPAGVGLTRLEATRATLQWPRALGVAPKYRLESRRVFMDANGELQARWDELTGVTVSTVGDNNVAEIRGLQPGTSYRVRVVPLGAGDVPGQSVVAQSFVTPAKARWWPEFTLLRGLFLVFAVCAGFMLRQRWAAKRRA